uniref:Cox19 family protein (CHCH motif) n=5 Tax=Panicoideae TaxID=147369 RepID=K3YAL2_SETIT
MARIQCSSTSKTNQEEPTEQRVHLPRRIGRDGTNSCSITNGKKILCVLLVTGDCSPLCVRGGQNSERNAVLNWRRREEEEGGEMAQPSKEPCKKEACDIQACLSKNMFDSRKCVRVIQLLQSCCEQCEYKSTHCGSLSGLLKNISK